MKSLSVIVCCLALASCAPTLQEGEVIAKRYEPERTFIMMIPVSVGETTFLTPYYYHDDADWVITIEGYVNGDMVQNEIYLTEVEYNEVFLHSRYARKGNEKTVDDHTRLGRAPEATQ